MKGRWDRVPAALALVLAVALGAGLLGVTSAGAAALPIVVGGARPSMPSISGSQVVWADRYDGNWDLFRYDGITGTTSRLTEDAADQSMPCVSGSRVAYVDYSTGNGDIIVRDLVTGVSSRFAISGDQTHPTLSGDWIAWEEHSTRSPRVTVRNLVTGVTRSAGMDGGGAERPRISGNVLVWEDHRQQASGRLDPDVWGMTLSDGAAFPIATSNLTEYYPDTNGRYAVWSQRTSDGYAIKGYDTTVRSYFDVSTGVGEHTLPAITDDTVYWVVNEPGRPLRIETFDLSTGARAPLYTYSTGDVTGIAASGADLAWLEAAGGRIRVRVQLGDGLSPLARVAALSPLQAVASSVRLALVATNGDATPPEVASTSVPRGAVRVPPAASLAVYFSEPIDPATLHADTVRVVDATTGEAVPATVRYSALTQAVTVDPDAPLPSGAFTLEVDPTITDAAGNALTEPTVIGFTTSNATVDVANPTRPVLTDVRTSGTASVQLTWDASVDDVAVAYYDIYRRSTPMSATDYAGRELVSTVASTTLTTTVPAKADELSKSFTYYYVVVARDTVDHVSTPSTNMAPNPHGTYSSTVSTNNCLRCHNVHGAGRQTPKLGARSAAACYECHGSTASTPAYGAKSTMDTQAKFNDDSAIAGGGSGISGGTGNDGWSIHRTDDMSGSSFGRECDACHSPHRKSYDDVPTLSYGRMLRIYSTQGDAGSAPAYSTDAAPFGERMCYECHGTGSLGVMDSFGGAGTYAATAGDHQSTYETTGTSGAAHNPDNVRFTTRAARPNGGSLPKIACLACHNEHASPVRALVDYRSSDTTSTANDQAGLCFSCHSITSAEGAQSTGTAPFSWNRRDVKAQFMTVGAADGASRHPGTAGGGRWEDRSGTVFSQTTKAQLDSNGAGGFYQTLSNTADGDGSVVLSQYTVTDPRPATDYLYYADSAPVFDALRPGGASWNADFDPANPTGPGAGAGAVTKNGVVFAMAGNSTTLRTYTPPNNAGTGVWGTTTAMWQSVASGSDIVADTTHGYIWALIGDVTPSGFWSPGTNIRRTDNFTGTTPTWFTTTGNYEGPEFRTGGNDRRLGVGAALAWVPADGSRPERLYVVNRDGTTTRDGKLYYFDNPDASAGGVDWTIARNTTPADQVLGTTGTANDSGSRMAYFRIGSADYLYFLRGAANIEYLMRIGTDAAGTLTVLDNATANPFNGNVAEGCDIIWNGDSTQAGFRLYAIQGGSTAAKVATWDGSALVWADAPSLASASGTGSYLAYAPADLAPVSTQLYNLTGTLTTSDIRASGSLQSWGTLTFASHLPNGSTSAAVRVQGWDGSAWVDVATANSSPFSLAGVSVTSYPKIRLVGVLTTTDQAVTPRIDSWSVTANWREWVSGSEVDTEWTSMTQSTKAEFDANGAGNFYQTVSDLSDGDGSVVLGTYTGNNPMPSAPYWFYTDSPVRLDSLSVGGAAWNADFDPTDPTSVSAAGASAVAYNGYLFALRGGGTSIDDYLPPANAGTGTWAGTTASWRTIGTGSDMCVDTSHDYIWVLSANGNAGNNTNGGTNVRRTTAFSGTSLAWFDTSGYDGPSFRVGGNDLALSNGAAMVWTPQSGSRPERLWIVNRNNTTWSNNNGLLYYYNNPDSATGGTNWAATTLQVGRNDTTADTGTRMVHFQVGTTDYIYAMRGLANLAYLAQLPTTDVATLTMIESGVANPFGGNIGDGADLVWNGDTTQAGLRILAIRGGNSTASAVGTWNGTTLVWTPGPVLGNAASTGSYLGYTTADPAPKTTTLRHPTGTLTSSSISPTSTAVKWGHVVYEPFLPSAQTQVEVSIDGFDGVSWTEIVAPTTDNPIDITDYWVEDFPQVRLVARLSTADSAQTPRLDSWSVTSVYERFQTSGSVTCVSCHNVHRVKTGGANYWQASRASDPDDINSTPTDTTSFCLRCHDGAPPVATRSAAVNVPYTVAFSAIDPAHSPLFPGWNKAAADTAFVSSGHYTATTANGKALCENCHDPHASAFGRLTAWTRPTGVTWTGTAPSALSRANTSTADAFEENLCYKCHGSGTAPTGKAAGAANVSTPAGLTYKHPMAGNGTTVRHDDLEDGADLGATNRHSECGDCHNPHAARAGIHATNSSTAGEVLRGAVGVKPTWSSAQWTSYTDIAPQVVVPGAGDDYEAYVCIKCHSKYSGQPYSVTTASGTYTSTDLALEFNPANDSGHNVLGSLTNWPKEAVGSFQSAPSYSMTWPTNATFQAGWSKTSKVTCSGCHTYSAGNARGPHGSTVRMLIDSAYAGAWQTAQLGSTTVICAKCHANLRNANDTHAEGDHSGADGRCIACHVKIPHGWKRPRLLGYTTDPEPYRSLNLTGITLKNYSNGSWNKDECGQTGCGEHNSTQSGTKWP